MFRRELGIWKRLRHSNILKLMGATSDFGPSVALVAPWINNGTLTSFLHRNNQTLKLRDRLLLLHSRVYYVVRKLRDIVAGLHYLHTFSLTEDGQTDLNPVVHGDLTGVTSIIYSIPYILMISYKSNVLIDGDRKAYLADFGLSGTFEKLPGMTYLVKMSCHPGAVRWAAPELLSGESDSAATTQSDMYSFGNIMLQVLTGNVPWCHLTRDFSIMYQVVIEKKMHPRPGDVYVTNRHWNFMTRCWSTTSSDRPPVGEAVQFVDSALHPSTSPQSPTLSISSNKQNSSTGPQSPTLSIPSDKRHPSTSPRIPTLSISGDERHSGIARNDYLRGDTDARLPVMQAIDSPLDARENHSGSVLPVYPSTAYTTSLEPSCKTPYRYQVN
ncbi:kinase-like domain-containing protein [Suillus subaureus]|uniref:Kinase-like domain-containing protein n=1 Tax=Suillus subaureus TaxID=48587 RepID=A0A9P7EHS5_9AGAM|nr:kinase-like domain-containing protein [Suillus subaureus]KAG1821623.1 kinase-like domain-containing protein [Suillus subaureus]